MTNQLIFQFFHWYYSPEGNLWLHAKDQAAHLASLGVTHVWLPPAYKSAKGMDEPGYAVYDLYDLGEFDQKGTVRTRYGTKEEYLDCIKTFQEKGIKVLADIVLNHRIGADEQEEVPVRLVKEENRTEFTSDEHTARIYTRYTFPGRQGKYSDYTWDWHSFSGACEDGSIAMIQNEHTKGSWEKLLEDELGNFDYLMGNDVEFRNPAVREELKKWGVWYTETTGVDGFRLDALKHITPDFFPEWLEHINKHFNRDFLCVGEYWKNNIYALLNYIEATGGRIQLFDVPLHFNFYDASKREGDYDLRTIFDSTLIKERPELAISFVDNHDTQPLQSLQSTVEYWFKPLGNALILLREQGIPNIFYPSLYEARYVDEREGAEVYIEMNKEPGLETMMKVRAQFAYGLQRDYFDDPHLVGWTREGNDEMEGSGIAVLLSNTEEGKKRMSMGQRNAGRTFKDCCGNWPDQIVLDENGEADFPTYGRSVSVWIAEDRL